MTFGLPPPKIIISFDGSTKGGNPGQGGAAAILDVEGVREATVSNRMGVVGNNCAEYYGLILGLREFVHLYPSSPCELTIQGDSEIVIQQLKGQYQVKDEVLKNYHLVAKGLVSRISKAGSSVRLVHIPREHNHEADALAKKAAATEVEPCLRFWHYPCLCSYFDATIIKGTQGGDLPVKAAHDYGAACYTPEIYIDASTLRQCYGEAALAHVRPTGKKILIAGKTDMTVLGITSLHFTLGHGDIKVVDAHVVDFLPWPLQISGDHPACTPDKVFGRERGGGGGRNYGRQWRSVLPPRFRAHPYWTSDVCVVGCSNIQLARESESQTP